MKVTILCGVSGSGKSTYIEKIQGDKKVFSADSYFMEDGKWYNFDPKNLSKAHAWCLREYTREVSQSDAPCNIVVDNTNTTVSEVAPYAALAQAYGHELEIVIIKPPKRRDALEKIAGRNVHGVPKHVVEAQYRRLSVLRRSLPPRWKVTEVEAEGL